MKTQKKGKKKKEVAALRFVLLPVVLVWLELVFHLQIGGELSRLWLPLITAGMVGLVLDLAGSFLRNRAWQIYHWCFAGVFTLLFVVQSVYYSIFKTYLTIGMFLGNAGDATQFWKEGMSGVVKTIPWILLLVAPLVAAILCRKWFLFQKKVAPDTLVIAASLLVVLSAAAVVLLEQPSYAGEKELLQKEWQMDHGVRKLGMLTGLVMDVHGAVTYDEGVDQNVDFVVLPSMLPTKAPTNAATATPAPTQAPEHTPTPTPTPIDRSPNVLDIPFAELAEKESNADLKKLHEYMRDAQPTNKNEYTGMFEGYNLIMLTCEGFSPWAVDEELTPTLYKLIHEGFYFRNFYTPIWITSTSDGEYAACTGLYPDLKKNNSFKRSADVAMPLGLGHQFTRLGYVAKAYHNNSYTYYGRNLSHPNLGYDYKAVGNGLKITKRWPQSDLEMMEVSIPEYINEERFHAYYMTVSGHLEYSFSGNSMAKKNKSVVENLPYSDACKAYIACNYELELAMTYLLEQLEAAGKLENTVIVMSADHYPYGLTQEQIEELEGGEVEQTFELYRNHCVIWSGSMKEPVVVDKYCSSVDIVPTLMNLFGMEYDSRLYSGQDMLSDASSLVIFKDGSFITDYCKYDVGKKKIIPLVEGVEITEDYIKTVRSIVTSRLGIARGILNQNYYGAIKGYLPK